MVWCSVVWRVVVWTGQEKHEQKALYSVHSEVWCGVVWCDVWCMCGVVYVWCGVRCGVV